MGCGDSKDTCFMNKNGDGVRSDGRRLPQLFAMIWQLDEERTMVQNVYGEDEGACRITS